MFTYPVEKWTGGIQYEHGHRLLGSLVGMLTIVTAILVWWKDDRKWMKWLAGIAILAVSIQGVLGGLTVLMRLPPAVSVSHALLAQSFMTMTMAMAAASSKKWLEGPDKKDVSASRNLQRLMLVTFVFTFFQILMGALTRHAYAGLAIRDFPLVQGGIVPDFATWGVTIHYLHRVGAVILGTLAVVQSTKVLRNGELKFLHTPSIWLLIMIAEQILMGGIVIWTREAIIPNTVHVAGGAIIFALTFLVYFRSRRFYAFAEHQPQRSVQVSGVGA
jgi:cytochrome c oxidase assembly protein subunit 15